MTDALIAGVLDTKVKKELIRSKWFTPSTIGNVVIADTEDLVYLVNEKGHVGEFKSTISRENRRLFLDRLKGYNPSLVGTLKPKHNEVKEEHAQWLSGIAAGAWFELHDLGHDSEFRFRRISPYGNMDCDGIYKVNDDSFNISKDYQFVHYSNCLFFNVEQEGKVYNFELIRDYYN